MALALRKWHKRWMKQLCMLLIVAMVAGSFSNLVAPLEAAAATSPDLVASYDFNGDFSDSLNNSQLSVVSGTYGSGNYTYGNTTSVFGSDNSVTDSTYWQWTSTAQRGGGFAIDVNPNIGDHYSIGVRFSYDAINAGYTKIIDYKDKADDDGFYFNGGKLEFYPNPAQGSATTTFNKVVDIIATRNKDTKKFTAYMAVNGVFQKEIEVSDTANDAIPTTVNGKIRFGFFHDDYKSAAEKTTGGKVYSIKVWNGPITQEQAQGAMNTPVPEAQLNAATAAAGNAPGTTKVTAAASSGTNKLAVRVSNAPIAVPNIGEGQPAAGAGVINPYTSGADISGVDATTNKYVGIYEIDASGKIVAFKLITLTAGQISPTGAASAPGGVTSGLVLWLNPVSVGATVANGGSVAEWRDLSGTDNHAVQATNGNQPIYYNNAANNVNFNPVVKFDGANDFLDLQGNKLPQGKTPRTIIAVGQTAAASANKYLISWGTGASNQMMGMMQLGTKGALSGFGAPYASPDGFWKQGIPNELFGMWEGNLGGNQASLYSKMGLLDSSPMTTWNTTGSSARIGAIVSSLTESWQGAIGDIMVYNRVLTDSERLRISTYLALKYGYMIDQTQGLLSNYVASDGTGVVWDATANSAYKNNIAGIGRDDTGLLNQRQSHSTNSGQQVTVGLNAIAATNSDNAASFPADKQYLVWGDNGKTLTAFGQTIQIADSTNWKPAERVWKVQNTNNVGTVQLSIAKSAFPAGTTASDIKLLVGSDASFATAAAIAVQEIGDAFVADNVVLPNGYFTFAQAVVQLKAPGGVNGGLHLWLRADDGVTAVDGAVSTWADKSGNGRDFNQATAAKRPDYNSSDNLLNFNPGITFDGTDDFLDRTQGILGAATYNDFNAFVVSGVGPRKQSSLFYENIVQVSNGVGTTPRLQSHMPWSDGTIYWDTGDGGIVNRLTTSSSSSEVGKYYIWDLGFGTSSNPAQAIYRDGKLLASAATGRVPFTGKNSRMTIGAGHNLGMSPENYHKGQIGEIVFYSGPLTAEQRQKIDSYLAIKYGITLDGINYVNAGGQVLWDAAAATGGSFTKNIAGIARDEQQGLHQKQSRGSNDTSKLTVAHGTLAASNASNPNALADGQALLWGDNGKTLTTFGQTIQIADSSYWKPAERVWKVQNTNNVGAVQLSIAKSAFPAGTTASDIKLLVGSDASFATAAAIAVQEIGDAFVADNVVLSNGYFTFAKAVVQTKAPGGVNGASLWIKADKDAAADGAGQLTGWTDQTGTNQFTVNGAPVYKADAVNFNPAVTFNNTTSASQNPNVYLKGSSPIAYQDGYAVFKQQDGTIVGSATPRASGYGVGIFTKWGSKTYIGNGAGGTYRGFTFNDASRYYMASFDAAAAIDAQGRLNGTAQTVTGNNTFNKVDFTPVIGGTFGGGNANNWNHYKGDIAEIVLFPASNTQLEKQRVESYLALKYGLTLNGGKTNYVASNGTDTMWTAGNNAGYGNRITGIGRDDGSDLRQLQSKSQDKDALVTIALGDAIQPTNALNANTIDTDLSFFVFSDNGTAAKYEASVLEMPGHTLKQLNRVFKVEKTKWQDKNITLKLNTAAENPAVLYYLIIDGANTGIKLDAAGQVTINSSMLANGSTFTFAKVYKDLLKAKVNEAKSLKEANYTPDSWAALQNALANAEAVLNNPGSTQEQVDAALATLEAARSGLSTGADKLKAKADEVQNEITLGSLKPGDYTEGSWQALTGALNEAKALLARTPQATAVELGQALAKLEAARGTLVDLSKLRAKEAEIVGENLKAGQYTADSWQALQQALTDARAVLANPNATQVEVNAAKAALEAARAALVPGADKTALLARANEVKGFTEANYTPASWAALQQAISAAEEVLNNPNATQAEVDAAKAALEAAIAGLGSTLPALQNKVNAVKGEIDTGVLKPGDYTTDSWQALTGALGEAEALLIRTPQASESELGQALSKLEAARGALVDLSGLRAKEAEASGVTAAVYTANSWQALQVVLTDARAVLVKPNATQAEVDAAKASLEAAIAALVPAANKAALLAKVNEVKGENLRDTDYTPESLTALKQALAAAEAVLNDPNATQQQVDAARDALDAARKNIVARGAKLSALTVVEADGGKPVALSPAFDPNQSLNYAGVVSNAVYGVGIVPVAHTPNSTIKVTLNGQPAAEADWSKLPLKEGPNTIKVEVTDPEGGKNEYTLEIMRTASKLVSLTPSSGNLEPAFNPETGAYTMRVTYGVPELSWTPVALDPNATIEISVRGEGFTPIASGTKSGPYGLLVGANTFVVKVTDRNGITRQYTITVTRASSSVWTDGGNTGTGTGTGTGGTGTGTGKPVDIATNVNGNNTPFATGTAGQTGGRTQTTVQIDPAKLNDILSQGNGQQLSIRVPNDGDVGVNGLTAEQVKRLADSGASLEVGNDLAIYPVPEGRLDLNGAAQQWNNAPLGDIEVHVGIKRASDALIGTAKDKAKEQGYELLVDPVDLELSYSYKGQTVGAGELNGYGVRYIALPDGIDPNRITTGVIVNPDGTVFHVPTVVTKINSRYYAMINDLRSSGTYSVIWNPQDLDDVRNHWSRSEVNDIVARLVLAGTGNNTFTPDRNVVRSEFAAIVATGMGLMRQNVAGTTFGDVPRSSWYHDAVAIASEFDIVNGYEDGLFHGDRQITREQGIAMIARAYDLVEPKNTKSQSEIESILSAYGDAANVSGWAKEAVARMIAAGIVEGSDGQLLKPLDSMTRAEAAALMRRLLQTTKLID